MGDEGGRASRSPRGTEKPSSSDDMVSVLRKVLVDMQMVTKPDLEVMGVRLGKIEQRLEAGDQRATEVEQKYTDLAEGFAAVRKELEGLQQSKTIFAGGSGGVWPAAASRGFARGARSSIACTEDDWQPRHVLV